MGPEREVAGEGDGGWRKCEIGERDREVAKERALKGQACQRERAVRSRAREIAPRVRERRGENGEEIERVTGEVVTTKIFVMNITFITKDL